MPQNLYIRNFTIEDVEAFGHRLHFNTVLDLFFNSISAYIVMTHSTVSMGNYKYYILLNIFTAAFMDLHISLIFGAFPVFPIPGFCAAGLSKYFGWFWGETIQYILMNLNLSFTGISTVINIIYQYYNIQGKVEFFHTKKCAFLIFIVMIIYPSPAYIFLIIGVLDHDATLIYIQNEAPHLYYLFKTYSCNAIILNTITYIYIVNCILLIFTFFIVILFLAYKIQGKMKSLKSTMSEKTLMAHQQLLFALALQSTIPFLFIVFPTVALLTAVLANVKDMNAISQWAIQILAFHSCANSMTIMFVIKPYRKALKKGITNIFSRRVSTFSISVL